MKSNKFITIFSAFCLLAFSTMAQGVSVKYNDGDAKLQGYVAKAKASNAKAKAPGIVILPAWFGLGDHEKESANRLAALGYNALAADVYGVETKITSPEQAGERSGYFKTNYKIYQGRITAAINELIKQGADPNKIVVMGYCFGGTGALEAARANLPVKGIISFHAGLGKDSTRTTDPIQPRVLVLHGADDPYAPIAEVLAFQQEMRNANADWQMIYYADAVHAFTDKSAGTDKSKGAAYNALADKRSWEHMRLFLNELFM